jgi:hypothetical protein
MSRPIAYNASGPLSGSIRGGNVNYTVDSGNRDYTTFASKKWVPSADGAAPIVFVTDTYTQGFELNPSLAVPLFYSCNGTGSAAILYTANRIPGSPGNYSDANVALNDLITARGYFILESNDPYQGDYQSGNLLTLDASKMSSYPQVGTNWLDLSGNDFDFSLQNGPTFNSNGWFGMDGGDDSIYLSGNSTLKSTNTLVMWMRTTDTTGLFLSGQPPYTGGSWWVGAYYPGQGFYNNNAGSPDFFLDTLATSNPATPVNYLDGRFHMWEAKGLNFTTWTTNWNFLAYGGGYQIAGDVAKIKMFDSYLTAAQSKQLYFGAPIVTDGLVFDIDANNIVSYPKSGTTTYSLTGSLTGSLLNGVGYLPSYGGAWNFDGVDDQIFINTNLSISSSFTIEYAVLIKELPTVGEYNYVFQNGAGYQNNGVYAEFGSGYYSICTVNSSSAANSVVLSNPQANVVYYATATYENRTLKGYINGNLVSTSNLNFDPVNGSNNTLNIGAYGPFVIPFWRFYNKSLSASEVLQNYQAEQYRFEGPSSIVTNGLTLWLDAGNLDSYPGTGTTWYDLSGNNNNGALKSAAQWSNLGWMNYDGNNTDTETTVATVEINTNSAQGNTVEQWIYGAALNGNGNMPFTWLDYSFDLWWYNNLFGINNGNSLVYGISGANSVLLNNWVHVVAYFPYDWAGSYTNAKLWINGVAQSMAIVQGSLVNITLPSSLNVGIGGGYTGGSDAFNWNGRISQTRIYTRELTTSEVQQNYNATKAKFGL